MLMVDVFGLRKDTNKLRILNLLGKTNGGFMKFAKFILRKQ